MTFYCGSSQPRKSERNKKNFEKIKAGRKAQAFRKKKERKMLGSFHSAFDPATCQKTKKAIRVFIGGINDTRGKLRVIVTVAAFSAKLPKQKYTWSVM